MNYIRKLYWGR